jgi:hypothetical protein
VGGAQLKPLSGAFLGVAVFVFSLPFVFCFEAAADKIGGSNLPSSGPQLKGRIAEGDDALSVVVITTSMGATSNAGPTLSETPSPFVDRGVGFGHVARTSLGRLDARVNLSERRYTSFDEADERSAQVALSLTKDWAGQQTLLAIASSRGRDVEERLTETSLSLAHGWTEGRAKPYVKAETALLDYGDVPDVFQPFRNQDDRDRVSSRAQIGLRLTLTDAVEIEIGGGVDHKRYLARADDFGVERGSVSVFPLVGLVYTAESGSLRALYMPFLRDFRDDLFEDGWRNGYALEGELRLGETLKAFASLRYGFEETDFLIASSAYEKIAVAGITWTLGKGTLSLAASETRRSYDDLDLVAVSRLDRKFEMAVTGEMPLGGDLSLNGRVGYLDYRSSFGDARTGALTASIGLTYAVTQ